MNNDLISRAALSEELSSLRITITGLRAGKGVLHEFMTEYRKSVLRIVDEAPTIDAEPVRHGRWEHGIQCPYCKQIDLAKPNYCPNCGTKMDLEG